MKLKLSNKIYDLDLSKNQIEIDGEFTSFEVISKNTNSAKVKIKNEIKKIYFVNHKDDVFVNVEGSNFKLEKVDPESEFVSSSYNQNMAEIMPPMPGSIIQIVAKKGDEVSEGDPLIIVEAMKMETTLYSPIDGKVTSIMVEEKEQVSGDEALVVIEKD